MIFQWYKGTQEDEFQEGEVEQGSHGALQSDYDACHGRRLWVPNFSVSLHFDTGVELSCASGYSQHLTRIKV